MSKIPVDVNSIVAQLRTADDAYFNSDATVFSDAEYDDLKRYAQLLSPHHEYFVGIGAVVRGDAVPLPYSMGSLTQCYIGGDIEAWIAKYGLQDAGLVLSNKLDGVSLLLVYGTAGELVRAYSRGDGREGADWTRHVLQMPSVPKQISAPNLGIRAELIMTRKRFQLVRSVVKNRAGQPYKTPRNMVSGVMNAKTSPQQAYDAIDCVTYEVMNSPLSKQKQLLLLKDNGFKVANYSTWIGSELTDDALSTYVVHIKTNSEYELDGVVIDVDTADSRQQIQPTRNTLNPEYARKFKITEAANLVQSTVLEVEWNISKDGYYKPRVRVAPVELLGVTVQFATGFNAKFITDKKVGVGAVVELTRAGDVVPRILRVITPADQTACPSDSHEWNATGVDFVLPKGVANDTVQFEQLVYFFNQLGVERFDEGLIRVAFDAGFTAPEMIITLAEDDLSILLSSKALAKKAYASIRQQLTNVPMPKLMGSYAAFGRGVGVRKFTKLYEFLCGDMASMRNSDRIVAAPGFDLKTATKILSGMDEFEAFLVKCGTHITIAPYVQKKVSDGPLSGATFVFTEVRSAEAEAVIISLGGTIGSSVSRKTHTVVAATHETSSGKATKARELEIPLVTLDELWKTLKDLQKES